MKIELPHVGESVTEGTIARWLKQVGDEVEKYAPLVEIITDKVNMEMPSPVSGKLTAIVIPEGETVPMGTIIAEIAVENETEQQQASAPAPEGHTQGQQETSPGASSPDRIGTLLKDVAPVGPTGSGGVISASPPSGIPAKPPPAKATSKATQSIPAGTLPSTPTRLSPAVQRLAAEYNLDPSKISGTGIGGRITRQDIEAHIAEKPAAPAPPPSPFADGDERMPVSPVRRSIADHMVKSATQIPHVWSLVEVDVSGLVARRDAAKEDFQQRESVPITYLAFVLKAVTDTLKEHRLLNSVWGGDHIVAKKRINIGVAVAAPAGLVVPVVRDADTKSITDIAKELHDLAEKAKNNRLALQDVQGGTFTVNNTGALGSVASQPLINHPQAAILTTEAIVRRPVAVGDEIAVRPIMNMVLGFDHRVMDGAEAGAFLQALKQRVEGIGPDTPI